MGSFRRQALPNEAVFSKVPIFFTMIGFWADTMESARPPHNCGLILEEVSIYA